MFTKLRRFFVRPSPVVAVEAPPAAEPVVDFRSELPKRAFRVTEQPTMIFTRHLVVPSMVTHTEDKLKAFVANGNIWGWAWKDDKDLILATLTMPYAGRC